MLNLNRLKAERIARGMTQEDMAKRLGWSSRARYAKREAGYVNIGADELSEMAKVLGYSNDDLGIFLQ